jgi:hypothetical protein
VDLDRLVASAPPQQSLRLAQKRPSDAASEHTLSSSQFDDVFDYQYPHAPDGHHTHIYEGEVSPYLHSSGTTSEDGQLWDQSLFALFDQMGPQYIPLHHNTHMAENMNYGSESWGESEQWSMYETSHPQDQ